MEGKEREGKSRESKREDVLVLAVKLRGANKINGNQGSKSEILVQKTVLCVSISCSVCGCDLNYKRSVHPSLTAVIAVPPELLSGNQHPSRAKVIERPHITLIICFLVLFGPVWEVLVRNFPAYLKKSPPADTSNAAETCEMGM